MKRVNKYGLLCVIVLLISFSIYAIKSKKDVKTISDLINIGDLSNEFMDDYFANVETLSQSKNKDNVLILISENEIKDGYGANSIVKGPNNQYYVEYETEEEKNNALEKFKEDKKILSAEENVTLKLDDTTYNSWGITKMKMNQAISAANSINAPEVVVAVIDSGVTTSLADRYYDGKTKATYNVLTGETTNMTDPFGHGTHVFGTIAEGTPDNVKIIAIKVTNGQTLSLLDLITGINYATYTNKADVINLSLGGYDYLQSLEQAIEAAKELNIITVAAAGNDNVSTNHYPSALSNTISISSVDSNLAKSSFSNYGTTIDFAAPGTNIKSIMAAGATIAQNNGNTDDNDHETISGTSMATPHVSSAVAILKSFNKNLTFTNVKDLLKKYAIDLGTVGWDQYYGYGFVSFDTAVFCTDGINCDEYNVFKNTVKKIEIANTRITTYNYGSITNLLGTSINIYYNNIDYITKYLWELDDLTITGYNPYSVSSQTVTISYGGVSTTMTVNHSISYQLGWTYTILNNKIILTGYKDSNYGIGKLYVPSTIANKDVSTINNCFDTSNDINDYREIILPSTLTSIGENAFASKNSIQKVTALATSVNIGDYAFASASNLKEFNGRMETIGISAFHNCPKLDTITLDNNTISIGPYAFYNTKLSNITIPRNVTSVYGTSFGGNNNLISISVNTNNTIYDSRNNCNCIIEKSTNSLVKGIYNTEIPSTVVAIKDSAFIGDPRIINTDIPSSITSIGNNAYYGCSNLNIINIPRSVTSIGNDVFTNTNANIWTYTDAYAKTYAISNSIRYLTLNPSKVELVVNKNAYVAFEEVEDGDIDNITLYYSRGYYDNTTYINEEYGISEVISNYDITYQNGEYFNYGDTYYIVGGINSNNEEFSKNINVTVSKAIPTYTIPNNIHGVVGVKLELIDLPEHFEWMDPDIIVTDNSVNYYAKYDLNDNNYSVITNINIPLIISENKSLVEPNIIVNDKIYDGTTNIDLESISVTNLNSNDYTITNAFIDNQNIGNRTAYITIRLTDDKFSTVYLEGELQEKDFEIDITVLPLVITKPTSKNKTYVYNEEEQIFEMDNYDNTKMNIVNNVQINAGSYVVSINLNNPNYVWDDNSTQVLNYNFTINKKALVLSDNTTDSNIQYDGNYHSINININTIDGAIIKYKDSNNNYSLDEPPLYINSGSYEINYKVFKDNNYLDYYGTKTLTIYKDNLNLTFNNYEGYYDGNNHSITVSGNTNGITIRYSLNCNDYNLNELPEYSSIGEYTICYKATKLGYNDLLGSSKVKIYGVKDFSNGLTVKNKNIIIYNETFDYIKSKIETFANSTSYYHYNSNSNNVNGDIRTGDIMHIVLNGSKSYNYPFALIGDINGDGNINSGDLLQIRQYLLGNRVLEGSYFIAGDINNDNTINSGDLLRIRQHLLGVKKITK